MTKTLQPWDHANTVKQGSHHPSRVVHRACFLQYGAPILCRMIDMFTASATLLLWLLEEQFVFAEAYSNFDACLGFSVSSCLKALLFPDSCEGWVFAPGCENESSSARKDRFAVALCNFRDLNSELSVLGFLAWKCSIQLVGCRLASCQMSGV